MNPQQGKSMMLERTVSQKFHPKAVSSRRPSAKLPTITESKKTLSKSSGFGSSFGSRVFFHKRGDRLKIPKYQNTYRLESFRSFQTETVDKLVREAMEHKLSPVTSYSPSEAARLCLEIGSDLQKAIGKRDYDRYKIVVQVTIVERHDQGINTGFQSLWDVDRDNYSYYVFKNNHIYAWCCVFGLYYE